MADTCTHLDSVSELAPSSEGCEDCLRTGGRWVHLRMCTRCGHVGCCDSSPNRHATAHRHDHPDHPLIRSYEPGEDWWWCYPDSLFFDVDGAPPAPSHPDHEEPTVTHKEILDELSQTLKDLRDHMDDGPGPVHAPRAFEAVREFAEQ